MLRALPVLAFVAGGCTCLGGHGELHFPDGGPEAGGGPGGDGAVAPADAGGGSDGGPGVLVRPEPLPESLYAEAVAFLDRKLWVLGGNDGCGSMDRAYYYDFDAPALGWRTGPSLPEPVSFGGVTTDGARAYLGGGLDFGSRSTDIWVFDPAAPSGSEWSAGGLFPTGRSGLGAGFSAGQILFTGGLDDQDDVLAEVWGLDPATLALTLRPPLPGASAHHASATWGERVYVVSGIVPGGGITTGVGEWNPASGWTLVAPLPAARKYAAAATLGGRVLVIGGQDAVGEPRGEVDLYDPVAGAWTTLPPVTPVAAAAAVAIGDAVYVVGGLRTTGPTADVVVLERTW
jgi:N-acetylneuraminic acid mutarotase